MNRLSYGIVLSLLTATFVGCGAPASTQAPVANTQAPAAAAEAAPTQAPAATAATAPISAPAANSTSPLLIVINKSADQQYFVDLQNSFVKTATDLSAQAKKFDAKLDPSLGVSEINDAISAGAKGIAITVPDQTIGPAIAQAAKDAGVVLIATDDNIKDASGNPVPFVGFDGKDMGKKVGEAAAKLLTDGGWLKDSSKKVGVLSAEVQTLSVCNDRTDNAKNAVKAAGVADTQIFAVPYTGDTLSAQDAAGPIITANPTITNWVVFGCNDEGALGTLNALGTAGVKTDNIIAPGNQQTRHAASWWSSTGSTRTVGSMYGRASSSRAMVWQSTPWIGVVVVTPRASHSISIALPMLLPMSIRWSQWRRRITQDYHSFCSAIVREVWYPASTRLNISASWPA